MQEPPERIPMDLSPVLVFGSLFGGLGWAASWAWQAL
jgi:hypothetical protein